MLTGLERLMQSVIEEARRIENAAAEAQQAAKAAGVCTCPEGWPGYICVHCGKHQCDNGEHEHECPAQEGE